MKWAFGVRQKLVLSTILIVVFALTFLNNLASKNDVHELGSSFSSVYEDRLLVESYIYQLSEILHRKKMMIYGKETVDMPQQLRQQHNDITSLLAAYDKTKLTAEETLLLKKLKSSFSQIVAAEQYWLADQQQPQALPALQTMLGEEVDLALTHLQGLSSIQLSEAKNLNESSKKIVAGSVLSAEMGSAMLIAGALVVLVLIFTSSISQQIPVKNPQLN